jgi:hypothetical protein
VVNGNFAFVSSPTGAEFSVASRSGHVSKRPAASDAWVRCLGLLLSLGQLSN